MDLAATLIVSRFLHFAAAMLLFGAAGFCGLLAPREIGRKLASRLHAAEGVLAWLVLVTAIAWLCCETGQIANGWADAANPATIWKVLTATTFGNLWSVHLVLALAAVATLLWRGRAGQQALALTTALVLMSLGFVGHAADQPGLPGLLQRLNDALHLLSSGFWVGSLPPLLLVLAMLRQPETRDAAGTALRRFSSLGHVAVALALLTGVINTLLIVGGLPLDFSVPYQLLLSLKIALVLLMLTLALVNRYVTVPRLCTGPTALRRLAAGTIGEIVIGAAVIALVSAFAILDPMGMDMSGGS
jgi:putative copper resistance protein D